MNLEGSSRSPRSAMEEIGLSPSHHFNQGRSKLPLPKRRRCSLKEVTFADEALVYPTSLTTDDVTSMWYSRGELEIFKVERRNLVKVLKKNDFDVDRVGNHFCLRGLEPYFSIDANRTAKQVRDCALQTVFSEQTNQRREGRNEPETLRAVVMEATRSSQEIANRLGLSDAAEARAIHESFLLEQLALRADKGLSLGCRRGVAKTPSLTQQEATGLARLLQQRQE